jgi:hypothetical protein
MPRDEGGIGRTGNKHKKKSTHDLKRRPKSSEDDAIQPSPMALDDVTNLAEQLNAGALASVLLRSIQTTASALAHCFSSPKILRAPLASSP